MSGTLLVRSPGRVNLIGGHVDFHDGVVVGAAIDRSIDLEVVDAGGDVVELSSDGFPGTVSVPSGGVAPTTDVRPPWGRLVAGVLARLDAAGRPAVGFRGRLRSTLPAGGGLSSSAAFELAVATAASAVADWSIDAVALAVAAQAAEAEATGVPCGIQDQLAIVTGGVARLDCRSFAAVALGLPPATSLLVVDSGVARTLEGSPWSARREASFAEARALGVERLRELMGTSPDALPAELTLARHVVGELARVDAFADALVTGDATAAGRVMVESHASSRDLWRSSTPELDLLVDLLVEAGAFGARLTGGGFGGCVVALLPAEAAGEVGRRVLDAYERATGRRASALPVRPAPPVAVVDT